MKIITNNNFYSLSILMQYYSVQRRFFFSSVDCYLEQIKWKQKEIRELFANRQCTYRANSKTSKLFIVAMWSHGLTGRNDCRLSCIIYEQSNPTMKVQDDWHAHVRAIVLYFAMFCSIRTLYNIGKYIIIIINSI